MRGLPALVLLALACGMSLSCPAGEKLVRATPGAGMTQCQKCDAGTFSQAGEEVCRPCAPGTVAGSVGSHACLPCPAGTFSASATHCASCPPGTYAGKIGSLLCAACPVGMVAPSEGSSSCTPCRKHEFAATSTSCKSCPPGTVPVGAECRACPAGKFAREGSDTCSDCAPGQYAPYPGSKMCSSCPAGTLSRTHGSTRCSVADCPANSHRSSINDNGCVCDSGFKGIIVWDQSAGAFVGTCTACPFGFWSTGDAQQCVAVACPEHASQHPLCTCNAPDFEGEVLWTGGAYTGSCNSVGCPANSVRSGTTKQCACVRGHVWAPKRTHCVPCEQGFVPNGKGGCERVDCPANSHGHPNCHCIPGFAGTIHWSVASQRYLGSCAECTEGTWSDSAAQACVPVVCPPNSGPQPPCDCRTGFSGKVTFVGGKFVGSCEPCPQGFWRVQNSAELQCAKVECPSGTVGHPSCVCSAGTAGSMEWAEDVGQYIGSCNTCPVGFAIRGTGDGLCDRIACPPNSSGHPSCACNTGFHGNVTWNSQVASYQGTCQPCPADTFQDERGKITCKPCGTGFVSSIAATQCQAVPCPVNANSHPHCKCKSGYAGIISWGSSRAYSGVCRACPPGYRPAKYGGCDFVACPEGAEVHPICRCGKGFAGTVTWNAHAESFMGSCTKLQCPPNSGSWPNCACEPGASGALTWLPSAQRFTGECLKCAAGTYQDQAGQFGCKVCNGAGVAPNAALGATACDMILCPAPAISYPKCICPAGYWTQGSGWDDHNNKYDLHCERCPRGHWAEQDSRTCKQVPCPENSSKHPECTCDEGYHGTIEWSAGTGEYIGTCSSTPCGLNAIIDENASKGKATPVCKCRPGFVVDETRNGTERLSCARCPVGTSWFPDSLMCENIACPKYSTNHPNCECWAGYSGVVHAAFDAGSGRTHYVGECTPCPDGHFSEQGSTECFKVPCPKDVAQETVWGECVCAEGFEGEMLFFRDRWLRRCARCGTGFYSHQGSPCAEAPCPEGATKHPNCVCQQGYQGIVTWDQQLQLFTGSCEPCPDGFASKEDGICTAVPCPANAVGHPLCRCQPMFNGTFNWDRNTQSWQGRCDKCPKGWFSSYGDETCTKVPCPEGAEGFPDCRCKPGYEGDIAWSDSMSRYTGFCRPCPSGQFRSAKMSECEKCPRGYWTGSANDAVDRPSGAASCTKFPCPEHSTYSEGVNDCLCDAGFAGRPRWLGGRWHGKCERCAVGYTSPKGSTECIVVPCPNLSSGHPSCTCDEQTVPGEAGAPSWNIAAGRWTGSCRTCPLGTVLTRAGASKTEVSCEVAPCPRNSKGFPCRCNSGFVGELTWDAKSGRYDGSCDACPPGTTTRNHECVAIECPPNTEGSPACKCRAGLYGNVAFNTTSQEFVANCHVCPPGSVPNDEGNGCVNVPCPAGCASETHPMCECASNHTGEIRWSFKVLGYNGTCTAKGCPTASRRNNKGECICNQGYFVVEGKGGHFTCEPCPEGTVSNSDRTECVRVRCPEHSFGHPKCVCAAGHAGRVTWSPSQQEYRGRCSACSVGFWASDPSNPDKCVKIECPEHSIGHPDCTCRSGFGGELFWKDGQWAGTCTPCEAGSWRSFSDDSNVCTPVECPVGAEGRPQCACGRDREGTITWDALTGSYIGECEPCMVGMISDGGSTCKKVECPAHSSGHPNCTCHEGFAGAPQWNSLARDFVGSCVPCPVGQTSMDGGECKPVACPYLTAPLGEGTDGNGVCVCSPGYFGTIRWSSESRAYDGNCAPCPIGFTTHKFNTEMCVPVQCPENSRSHPFCACEDGFVGSIQWNSHARIFEGTCKRCNVGFAEEHGKCKQIPCDVVPNAVEIVAKQVGDRACGCQRGFLGSVSWDGSSWVGMCNKCSPGFTSSQNKESGLWECVQVDCPQHSSVHPYCVCDFGMNGLIEWTGTHYTGTCVSASQPSPLPSTSPSQTISLTPSSSFSASVSLSPSASPTPSLWPCDEDLFVDVAASYTLRSVALQNQALVGVQGLYTRCEDEYNPGMPKFCNFDWEISFIPGGHFRESQWLLSNNGVDVLVADGEQTLHLPVAMWKSPPVLRGKANSTATQFLAKHIDIKCATRRDPGCCVTYTTTDGSMSNFSFKDDVTAAQCLQGAQDNALDGTFKEHLLGRTCNEAQAENTLTTFVPSHMLIQQNQPTQTVIYRVLFTVALDASLSATQFLENSEAVMAFKAAASDLGKIPMNKIQIASAKVFPEHDPLILVTASMTTSSARIANAARRIIALPNPPKPFTTAITHVLRQFDSALSISALDVIAHSVTEEAETDEPEQLPPGKQLSCGRFSGSQIDACLGHAGCSCTKHRSRGGWIQCDTCDGVFVPTVSADTTAGLGHEHEFVPLVTRKERAMLGTWRKSLAPADVLDRQPTIRSHFVPMIPKSAAIDVEDVGDEVVDATWTGPRQAHNRQATGSTDEFESNGKDNKMPAF